jgi:hypothetical protein
LLASKVAQREQNAAPYTLGRQLAKLDKKNCLNNAGPAPTFVANGPNYEAVGNLDGGVFVYLSILRLRARIERAV